MIGSGGLTTVSNQDLHKLLRAVHKGDISCPIDRIGLATTGLLRLGDELGILRGLDARSVRAVLVSVLAERGPRR